MAENSGTNGVACEKDQIDGEASFNRVRTRGSASLTNHCVPKAGQHNQSRTTNKVVTRRDTIMDREAINPLVDANSQPKIQAHILEKIACAYEKNPTDRTEDEIKCLFEHAALMPDVEAMIKNRQCREMLRQRDIEFEESQDIIQDKVDRLAELIEDAEHIVIYTGAGISTSASIPDYRGPNGLWTQLRKTGTFSMTKLHDLSSTEPTYTHMAIMELCKRRYIKHIVSQNCDGLHIRSGIPQSKLSEIHGNMYIEVCPSCEKQYYRQADVTERTSRFRHKTGRRCHNCPEPNNNLIDTIVLYGERSRTKWPMNWDRASKAAKRADLIICMGSSLKTLRRYSCLWPKTMGSNKKGPPDTKLVIINLQYTSKDKNAVLKINGKCDLVMQTLMQRLDIRVPDYDWTKDPLLNLAIPFVPEERALMNRNLIFENHAYCKTDSPSSASTSSKRNGATGDSRDSPSLFVSEITDDPKRKELKMRIRAVNSDNDSKADEDLVDADVTTQDVSEIPATNENKRIKRDESEPKAAFNFPGWLGKSLGSRAHSYRRKRHGNKGRKHSSTVASTETQVKQELLVDNIDVVTEAS